MTGDADTRSAAIDRDYPWNRAVILGFEFTWGVASSFSLLWTMVPAYLVAIGASKLVVGVVASLYTVLTPIQFLSAHRFGGRSRKVRVAVGYVAAAIPWLLYGLFMTAFPGALSPPARVAVFSVIIFAFTGVVCSTDVLYGSVVLDNTPRQRRGVLFAQRLLVLSVGMSLSALIARRVMRGLAEPANYHLAFIIGPAVYCLASALAPLFREHVVSVEDAVRRVRTTRYRLWPRIRLLLRKLTKNPNYRITVFFLVALFVAKGPIHPLHFGLSSRCSFHAVGTPSPGLCHATTKTMEWKQVLLNSSFLDRAAPVPNRVSRGTSPPAG